MAHAHGTHMANAEHGHERTTVREPFGMAQLLSLGAGIFFVVTGAIALARGGVESITEPTVAVGGLGMTPLLAILHLVVGIVALAATSSRAASRSFGFGVGPFLIAAGLVALLQPVDALGWEGLNGVVYLLIGALGIIAAMTTPAVVESDSVTTF